MIGAAGTILELLGRAAKPVAKALEVRGERKHALQSIQAKAAVAREQGQMQARLSEREWEMIALRAQADTWKDEFVVVVVFSPFITLMVGSVLAAFGRPELAVAATEMMKAIAELDISYGWLLVTTAGSALGLRWLKR